MNAVARRVRTVAVVISIAVTGAPAIAADIGILADYIRLKTELK